METVEQPSNVVDDASPPMASSASGTPRRNPWGVGLIALILGPVAFVYLGRIRRAIGWLLAPIVPGLGVTLALLWLPLGRSGIALGATYLIAFHAAQVYDAVRLARDSVEGPRRRFQSWWGYALSLAALACMGEVTTRLFRTYIADAYLSTTVGMRNTLLPGERFINDRLVVRLRSARRGEMVTYRAPESPETLYSHRVVAIEGDTVGMRNEQLFLNEQPVDEPYALWEGVSPSFIDLGNFGPVTIPAGHVFVLGDNRRSSRDSRDFGAIRADDIVGVVRCVFWSREYFRNMSPTGRPLDDGGTWGAIRWSRIGRRLDGD
jgi:signal peptidase I